MNLVDTFALYWGEEQKSHSEEWPCDKGWRSSIVRFGRKGLTRDDIASAIFATSDNEHVASAERWKYFCGICWTKIRVRDDKEYPGLKVVE